MENKNNDNINLVLSLIEHLKNNPKFIKLVSYSLTTIKSTITMNDKQTVESYVKILLTKSLFSTLSNVFEINKSSEEIIIKIGELIFCLVKLRHNMKTLLIQNKLNSKISISSGLLMRNQTLEIKEVISQSQPEEIENFEKHIKDCLENYDDFISKEEIFNYILHYLSLLDETMIESYQIFIKILQLITSDTDVSNSMKTTTNKEENSNFTSVFSMCLNLLSKLRFNETVVIYLIETIKKLFLSKEKFRVSTEDQEKLVNELNTIIRKLGTYKSNAVVRESIELLKIIIQTHPDAKKCYKDSKPISIILKVMSSADSDNSLCFHSMQLLADILEKADIEFFLKFLSESKSVESIDKNLTLNIIKEFDLDLITNEENNENNDSSIENKPPENEVKSNLQEDVDVKVETETEKVVEPNITPELIISLRKNIAKVLIMLTKDNVFLKILSELNSIETLVELIQLELEEKKESNELLESILPNFLKLVFRLLSEMDETGQESELVKKIGQCLLKALTLLNKDSKSVLEIVEILLSTKNQLLLETMSKGFLIAFKPVFLSNYTEQKIILLIMKMNTVIQSYLRYSEVTSKKVDEGNEKDKEPEKNELKISSSVFKSFFKEVIVPYDSVLEKLKSSFKNIEKIYESHKIAKEIEKSENEETSINSKLTSKLTSILNPNKSVLVENTEEISSWVKFMKENLLELSYGMLWETKFPENLFHEICVFNKSLLKKLNSGIQISGFSDNNEFIKIYCNFLILCLINPKFGNYDEKLSAISGFLNYLIMEHGIPMNINNFILKLFDFYLFPENKGLCKQMINTPAVLSYITGTMEEYIIELKTGSFSEQSPFSGKEGKDGKEEVKVERIENKRSSLRQSSVINSTPMINTKSKLEGELLENLLKSFMCLLKHNTQTSFSQFIKENGIVMVIELCGIKVFDFETSKLIVKILQYFSSEGLFKLSSQYFKK